MKMRSPKANRRNAMKNRLEEAEETLRAIRDGRVDAVVVSKKNKNEVYTLRSSDYIYRMLVEKMREGALTLTPEGMILYSNQQFAQMTGMKLDRLIGTSIFEFVSPLNKNYLAAFIAQSRKGGNLELELVKKNGENFPAHISVNAFSEEETQMLGMIVTDLSRLKLAEIVEFNADAIFRKNLEGLILSWNKGAERLFGFTEKEMIGSSIEKIIPDYNTMESKRVNARITRHERLERLEMTAVRKDKRPILLSLTYSPIADPSGNVIGAAVVARDITKEREFEKQKDTLIGIASHELKTPVTTIKGYAQILSSYLRNSIDRKPLEYLAKLEGQVDRITTLINDLLDVSKIEAGKLELITEKFDVTALAKEIAEDMQQTTDQKIVFEGSSAIVVFADKHRISQVVINLISNAIKFSPENGKIIVAVKGSPTEVEVCVKDQGIGIQKKDLKKVFTRFFQADSSMRKSNSGLGLGLYICHEIVSRHEGKIWVDSGKGKGSAFTFSLPLNGLKKAS